MTLGQNGAVMTDDLIIQYILQPYRKPRDKNLGKEYVHVLREKSGMTEGEWQRWVAEQTQAAEEELRKGQEFAERCSQQAQRTAGELHRNLLQLEIRDHLNQESGGLGEDIRLERVLHQELPGGVERPRISVDAVGVYLLSTEPCPRPS